MKKIILVLISMFMIVWVFSQSLELYYDADLLNPTDEITLTAHPDSGLMVLNTLDVKNISDVTLGVVCVRKILENIEGSENSFCWGGLCFPPYVDTSFTTTSIDPQGISYEFSGDHDPKGYDGTTRVKYTFYDIENPDDNIAIIINYDASEPNAAQKFDLQPILSKAYPNPANNLVSVDYDLRGISNARVAFFNLLGSKVDEIELLKSEGTLTINTTKYTEGIYFYSLLIENEVLITQKIIIRH
jgi:hypothetical protein